MQSFSSFCSPWTFGRGRNQSFSFRSDLSEMDEERILRKRLASGEIDTEEFYKIMDILNKTNL